MLGCVHLQEAGGRRRGARGSVPGGNGGGSRKRQQQRTAADLVWHAGTDRHRTLTSSLVALDSPQTPIAAQKLRNVQVDGGGAPQKVADAATVLSTTSASLPPEGGRVSSGFVDGFEFSTVQTLLRMLGLRRAAPRNIGDQNEYGL